MVREYDAGATTAELRLKCGLAHCSLLKLLRANGAVIRRQGLTAAQEKAAVGLYESCLSIGSIAEQLSASYTTVRNCLLRAQVEMRDTHDWHDAPPASSGAPTLGEWIGQSHSGSSS